MLASFLAITVGIGMAGVAPAVAAPSPDSSVADTAATGADSQKNGPEGQEASDSGADKKSAAANNVQGTIAPQVGTRAATGAGMFLEKNLTSSEVIRPGDFVNYEIKLGCSSNTEPCSDAYLIDTLPEPLVLKSINYNGFAKDITEEPSEDGTSVKLTLMKPLRTGQEKSVLTMVPTIRLPSWRSSPITRTPSSTASS